MHKLCLDKHMLVQAARTDWAVDAAEIIIPLHIYPYMGVGILGKLMLSKCTQ